MAQNGDTKVMPEALFKQVFAENECRALSYNLFGRLFREQVNLQLLKVMRHVNYPEMSLNDSGLKGFALIADYLSGKDCDVEALEELAEDYNYIFSMSANRDDFRVNPLESEQFGTDEDDKDDLIQDVIYALRQSKMGVSGKWAEHPDHISTELEFMGVLAGRGLNYLEDGDFAAYQQIMERQNEFFNGHIANWMPQIMSRISVAARTDFYKGSAQVLLGFIQREQTILPIWMAIS